MQIITTSKAALSSAVNSLSFIANNRNANPDFRLVSILSDCKERLLKLVSQDYEQCLEFSLEADFSVESDVTFAVNCQALKTALRSCRKKADELTLKFDSKELAIYNAEGKQLGILAVEKSVSSFSIASIPKKAEKQVLASNFQAFLADAAKCVHKDKYKALLNSINISNAGISSTDGKRLLHIALPLNSLKSEVNLLYHRVLPSIKEQWLSLSAWTDETKSRSFVISGENFNYFAYSIGGSFPNWQSVVPEEKHLDTEISFSTEDWKILPEFLKELAKDKDEYVRLFLSDKVLFVQDSDKRELALTAKVTGALQEGTTVTLKAEFLHQFLEFGHRSLLLNSQENRAMKARGGIGYYVFMGCALEKEKDEKAQTGEQSQNTNSAISQESQAKSAAAEKVPKTVGKIAQETSQNAVPDVSPRITENRTNPTKKGKETMSTNHETETDVFTPEDALSSLTELRTSVRAINQAVTAICRKFRAGISEQKQRDRLYQDALKKLERIREASVI